MEKAEFSLYLKSYNKIKNINISEKEEKMKEKKEKNIFEEEMSEERKSKLLELEKQLGRHDNTKKIKAEKDHRLIKYFLVATNMMYTLAGPIILMLGLYLLLKKFVFKEEQPLILVVFLFIGAFTGYWSLIKQITNIK